MAKTYVAGVVTAYGAAVEAGYTGTYEEFCEEQAKFAENAQQVAEDRQAVEAAAATFTEETVPAAQAEITAEGTAQVEAVGNEGETQRGLIQTAGEGAVASVQAEGADQITGITAAGNTQVGNVNTAGSTQIAAVNSAGASIINALPNTIAANYSASKTYAVGDYVLYNNALYQCTTAIETAEEWTAEHWSAAKVADEVSDLNRQITALGDMIPDTAQTIAYAADGSVQSVTHTRNGTAVRTDVFTFGDDQITEVRTLATGESMTIVTVLSTLITTITYSEGE